MCILSFFRVIGVIVENNEVVLTKLLKETLTEKFDECMVVKIDHYQDFVLKATAISAGRKLLVEMKTEPWKSFWWDDKYVRIAKIIIKELD